MKNNFFSCGVFVVLYLCSVCSVEAEVSPRKLMKAMQTNDISAFREYLEAGANPNIPTEGTNFGTSSSCQSAKEDKLSFFEAIVDSGASLDVVSPLASIRGSLILCAIHYNNFEVYSRLRDLGVDINSVQNPAAHDSRLFLTPIDMAVMANRFKITMDILNRIQPTESQIRTLVITIDQTPGIKGHKEQPYRDELADWLLSKGYNEQGPEKK
jgi:hypothetical protein